MTLSLSAPCTCGNPAPHIIGRRRTADNIGVTLWSHGPVLGGFGALPEVPVVRPSTVDAVARELRAGWLLLGEVSLYEFPEVPRLYAAARSVAARNGSPADVRAEFERLSEPKLKFLWQTIEADNRGDWTLQVARLNRFQWPRMSVERTRAGYEVMNHVQRQSHVYPWTLGEVAESSGVRFTSQRDLVAYLMGCRVKGGGK